MGLSFAPRILLLSALLLAGVPASLAGATPTPKVATRAAKKPKKPKTTTVVLYHLNRRDSFTLRQKDMQGRPPKGFQKRFDHFLRCHYTNKQHAMNPRLVRLLYQTGRHWPGKRIEVVSGYRSPKYNLMLRKKGHQVARHSQHMEGNAVDFRIRGVATKSVLHYVKSLRLGGVGYYPNSQFVHSDTGPIRYWTGS